VFGALIGGSVISLIAAYLLVRYPSLHGRLSADSPETGPQKFHFLPTPRIGGIPVLLAAMAAAPLVYQLDQAIFQFHAVLVCCATLAFIGGLAEDLTKRVSVRLRLLFTFLSAGLAFFFLDARVSALEIPGLDWALQFTLISFIFTLFAVGGFAHATNIVDGFNGLAAVVALIYFGSIAYVASAVGDTTIFWSASLVAAAVFGFSILNFPKGLIFLGDGGAYLIGFLVAEFAVMLVHRNTEVSPWFALTLLSYPIFETLFSMYRKRVLRRQSPGEPDGLHLHMLIHKRLVRGYGSSVAMRPRFWANALTSPYLWVLAFCGAAPALLFWWSTPILQMTAVAFAGLYLWLYWRIVRFKTPRTMVLRRGTKTGSTGDALEQEAEEVRSSAQ
jgi:UDP-N-acetylmuramyl pentapeptide phosphotransferase/UDP-N-acetylglucosamine-1-phosphate transferase